MGVLGWIPDIVEFTNMPDILTAYEAKIEWHNATNGVDDKKSSVKVDANIDNFDMLTMR